IPRIYDRATQVYGPKVGGVFLSEVLGEPSMNGVYLKK
ncbi:MAG: hypothetical protein QOE05_749, partial [Actinomycetota bacterium]|nr:hypothetical protein [Actinomycetota bacterium]